jgi:hypothetical protein
LIFDIPTQWKRNGLLVSHADIGDGTEVVGDPCIVWDETLQTWRMFLFIQPGGNGQAIFQVSSDNQRGNWQYLGPIEIIGAIGHKPFIVMNPYKPNQAAVINGRYCLLIVSFLGTSKVVQQAWATTLAGPWEIETNPLIPLGDADDFDAKHIDAVSGYYFPERDEILYFYMGYPLHPQPHVVSPYGSALGAAIMDVKTGAIRKLGVILQPSEIHGHWASGYIGGMQLLPGSKNRWIGLINASPTPPSPEIADIWREEPPPSLGGFAYCDALFPITDWHLLPEPIEYIENIPEEAQQWGERTNLWRQHLWIQPNGDLVLVYNSGPFGNEQLFSKHVANS